jgi:hypothetical protein
LEDNRPTRTANQKIGTKTNPKCDIAAGSDIATAQRTGTDARTPGKNIPRKDGAARHPEVKTDSPDPALITVLPPRIARAERAIQILRRADNPSDARGAGTHKPADPESLRMRGKGHDRNQSRNTDRCQKPVHFHLNFTLGFVSAGSAARPIASAKPERDAEANQKDSSQQEKNDGLLEPGYRGNGDTHRKTKESRL